MSTDIYFIRFFNMIGDARFAPPRRRDSVRRSLNGTLCVLAFPAGNAPSSWKDGRTADEIREYLALPEHVGIWYTNEEL
jgi:hypothetical protein